MCFGDSSIEGPYGVQMNLQPYHEHAFQPDVIDDAADDATSTELGKNEAANDQQVQDADDDGDGDGKELVLVYIYNLPPWIKWRELKSFLVQFIKESSILHIQIWPMDGLINGTISLNSYESSIQVFDIVNNFEWNGFLLSVRIEYENYQDSIHPVQNHNYGIAPPQFQVPQGIPQYFPQPILQGYPQTSPAAASVSSAPNSNNSTSPFYSFVPPFFPYQQPQPPQQQQQQQMVPPPGIHILSPPQLQQQIHHQQHFAISQPRGYPSGYPSYTPLTTPSNPISRTSSSSSSRTYAHSSNDFWDQQQQQQQHYYGLYPSPQGKFASTATKIAQPSRQLTLRQLNYHDITDISDPSPGLIDRTRLFIGNIPFESDWRDLKDLLRRAGNIMRVEIPRMDNRSKGFGIATFANELDAKRAIEMLDGVPFQGRNLTVRYDKFPRIRESNGNNNNNNHDEGIRKVGSTSPLKKGDDDDAGEQEVSFDDGEFAKEARSLVESLNINK